MTFGQGGNINIGDYCYIGKNSNVWSAKDINIGNRVLIAHNCNIFDSNTHPLDPVKRHEQFKKILEKWGITVTIRDSMGREMKGACGQLGYEKLTNNDEK